MNVLTADFDFERQSKRKNPVGDKTKRNAGLFMSFVLALAFLKGVKGDDACNFECNDFGTPIPDQIKYQTPLFIPAVIDLREKCGPDSDILEMYMMEGKQDWGIKDSDVSETPLMTTIWGYVLI